jgi:hypothetical protein
MSRFRRFQVSRHRLMRASSRLILPSIVFLWVNSHPNEECFSVGRAIDCRGIYTKSIGRWFDSGCWDLHFFLRARWPRPMLCSETQTRSNGAYWYSKWNLRLYGRPGLLYASEDCHGPRQHLATRFRRVREEPKEPRNQGTKEPRNQGTKEPRNTLYMVTKGNGKAARRI